MDFCFYLFLVVLVLFLIALAGHGLWVLFTPLFRKLFGEAARERQAWPPRRRVCVRCGCPFPGNAVRCPECGLDPADPLAEALRRLENTAQHIQALVQEGTLSTEVGEEVYRALESKQQTLMGGRGARKPDAVAGSMPVAVPMLVWQMLEQLLRSSADVRLLEAQDRKKALDWYRGLSDAELGELSAPALLALARVVRMAGLSSRSFDVYRLLIKRHGHTPEGREGAMEASRAAEREHRPDLATWFEERAVGGPAIEEIPRRPAASWATPAAHPTEPPQPEPLAPVMVVAERPPRRSFGQMMMGFMEERNILWGELMGGLLIVGCSIALVISLWGTLEKIPYFPFLIFAALTGALFGAGLYTLSHWKLEATSRGLLVIATLLTPLNFLILAGLWRGTEADLLDWSTEAVALVAFSALVWRSGRILVAPTLSFGPWRAEILLALAIVGASSTQLFVPHLLKPGETTGPFRLLSFTPVVLYALAMIPVLYGLSRRERVDRALANGLFLFVGQAFFAMAVVLGFLIYWQREVIGSLLQFLALPCALAGMPFLVTGTMLHRQLDRSGSSSAAGEHGLSLGLVRLLGTLLAMGGMVIMLAALMPAWPRPTRLLEVGLLNAIVFSVVALRYRIPHAHIPALLCLAVVYLTALIGELEVNAILDRATTFPALAFLLVISSEGLIRSGRTLDGRIHILAAAGMVVVSLVVVGREGFAHPWRGAVVFGVSGLGTLIVNTRWRNPLLTYAGNMVVLGALAYLWRGIDPHLTLPQFWALVLLTHATLSTVVYLVLRQFSRSEIETTFVIPMRQIVLAATMAVLFPLALAVHWQGLTVAAGFAFWLAAIWLVIAGSERWPGLFVAFQTGVTAATLLALSAWLQHHNWVTRPEDLLHLWSLQTYLVGLAILSVIWIALRRGLRSLAGVQDLLDPDWKLLDWAILGLVVVFQFVLTVVAVWPEVVRELFPPGFLRMAVADHPPLALGSAWSLVAVLVVGLGAFMWERRPDGAVLGLLLLAVTAFLLTAVSFRADMAVASAGRWGLGICFLGCSMLIWRRERLLEWCGRWNLHWPDTAGLAPACRWLLLATTVGPVLLLTLIVALLGFAGEKPPGPAASSIFARLGWIPNMVIPLVLVGAGLFGHGVREKAAGYIFAAGLILAVTLTGGYALGLVLNHVAIDETEGVFIVQLGSLAAGLWGLGWLGSGRWRNGFLLSIQGALAMVPCLGLLTPALIQILMEPAAKMPDFVLQAGHWLGWLGLLTATIFWVWWNRITKPQWTVDALAIGGILLGILAACALAGLNQSDWLSYHVLILAGTSLGLLLLSAGWIGSRVQRLGPMLWNDERRARAAEILKQVFPAARTQTWVDILGVFVVLLALRSAWSDPGRPYWSGAATLAIALLLGAQAVWVRRPAFVYVSGLLLNLVGYLAWQSWLVNHHGVQVWMLLGPDLFDHFLFIQVLCFATGSAVWSLVDWRLRLRLPPVDVRANIMPYPHAAALAAHTLMAVMVLTAIASDLFGLRVYLSGDLAWTALFATGLALLICVWDAEASLWGLPASLLFAFGVLIIGLGLHQAQPGPSALGWYAALALAGYLAGTSAMIRLAPRLQSLWRMLRIPPRSENWLVGWYGPAQALIGILVIVLSVWMCLDFPGRPDRLGGPLATALVALAGAMMVGSLSNHATDQPMQTSSRIRQVVLGLGVGTAIEMGWALLDPTFPAPWLHRNSIVLAVTTILAGVYTAAGVRGTTAWASSARSMGGALAVVAPVMLAIVLIQEFFAYDKVTRSTPLAWPAALLVGLLLAGVLVASLVFAVASRNPLGLTDRGRVNCVWLAELLVVLVFVHVKLNVPDLFPMGRNWVFVMMALGFAGVGLGELFQRRGLPMLAEPLQRTGLFLPLLPLLAFLARPLSEISTLEKVIPGLDPFFRFLDHLPEAFGLHALLWFLLGLLYAWVALLRRASGFALLAALAANFGLWVLLAHQESLAFLLHPQLWLVPLGLIVLAAEYLNRSRLFPAQGQTVRYAGLLLIYLSSSADMFITGLGESVLLPVVLAVLAIAGVLAGILFRVRAFLFLGVAFLGLVVLAQIWHAAVDRHHTWVWWAAGIVLGALILTMFALFEKRRQDVLRLVDDIKQWQ